MASPTDLGIPPPPPPPPSQALGSLIVCTGNELVTVYIKACQAAGILQLASQRSVTLVMMSTSYIIMFL